MAIIRRERVCVRYDVGTLGSGFPTTESATVGSWNRCIGQECALK